ncbi:GNAT family N-acetyltransferase [Micromonospora sp. NPDC049559]|uniref:GNAT family N-acetyltransferase n=1 Tax=Micromonospora sp. NPDC049559 TaxID=3155923 RepID=UPI003436A3F0
MQIRPAVPDDAPAVVALRALVYPYLVRGVESTRQMIANPPPGEEWVAFVAEHAGRVVGWVSAYVNARTAEPGFGEISLLHVHPEHRGRGTGTALLTLAREHVLRLDARRIRAWAQAESLGFARRHGFEPGRELRYSSLALRPAPPAPTVPAGVELAPLTDLTPELMYAAEVAAASDEPEDAPQDAIPFESWRYDVWDNIGLDRDASVAVLVDGEVVAFSLVKRDGERMWSDMTATRPEYRGRGLARLAKRGALHRAAERGVTVAYTSNDEANAPMLAVNARLGYRPIAAQWSCLASVG